MKQKIVKLCISALLFIAGILIGAIGVAFWSARSLQFAMESMRLNYSAFENKEATEQYLYATDIKAGIYALDHLIKFKEAFYKDKLNEKELTKTFFHDLVIAYGRLGNLYEKQGDQERALQNYRKGLEIVFNQRLYEKWKGTEKEIKSVDDLKRFIAELDKRSIKGREKKDSKTGE